MKIVCGSCGAKYSIADEKVQGKIFKIRCKKCDDVIVVKGTSEGEDLQAAESDFGGSYGHSDGASEWYVVLEGEQVGPITAEEVEAYFSIGQLSNDSFVWRDGLENWVPINSISEFAHLVHMGGNDDNTMIAAPPSESGYGHHHEPADDETAVIDSAKFQAGLYGMGGENPTYSAPDTSSQSGYSGYDHDPYAASSAPSAPAGGGYSGYEDDSSSSASYNDGYAQASPGYDDGYDSDGGGGMFAAFDSAPAEENDYSGGFGGGFGGGSQEYGSGATGGMNANAAVSANEMVGARNENSVLFSLSSLDQVQAVSKPAGGVQNPAAGGGNDKSGLIDIQALASAHASMKSGGAAAGGGAFGGGGDNFAPSTMSMPALMPMPMGSHRNNKGLMMAVIIGGSVVFVGLIAVVAVLLMKDPPAPTVITEQAVADAAPVAPVGNPEADAKLAAEAAEAARAALLAAQAPVEDKNDDADKEEARSEEDPRDKRAGSSASKASAARVEAKAPVEREPVAAAAPKAAPKAAAKPASKGGIDDILGQIDSKGSGSKPAAAAASSAPSGDLPPKLTRPHVQSTVRQYNAQILRCQQASNSNKLSGTVTVRFTVQPSGAVSAANVQSGEFKGTDVGGCIEGAVKGMKFPATQSDLTINYPFIIR